MTTATLNGIPVIGVRLLMPWRGAWVADVDLDPLKVSLAPTSGPAVLVIGASTLKGTVDPRGSGSFVSTARVRLVAGGGGWDKPVAAQHYHNDAGVLSTLVYSATAGQVGEVVTDLLPTVFGPDFVTTAGPASRVLGDAEWHVDALGVTHVGPRAPAIPDPSMQLLSWEPLSLRAELTCDALVVPGTPLVDPRVGGSPVIVRDVEQTFTTSGSRATVYCAAQPVSRLAAALKNMVREFGETTFLKVYRYRVVTQGPDGRPQLQVVQRAAGVPDVLPVSIYTGMSGVTAKLTPGTQVLVEFLEGDPKQPVVHGFSTASTPLELDLDATVMVKIAGGVDALVLATPYAALLTALEAFATALAALQTAPLTPVGAAGTTLQTALAALPAPATMKTRAT